MRDLVRNQTNVWIATPSGVADVTDDGLYTGEQSLSFPVASKVGLALYPANGKVVERMFGTHAQLDMVATSTTVDLTPETLVFMSEPEIGTYEDTYDYSVSMLSKSLNSVSYGLKARV